MTKEGEITQLMLANSELLKQMDVQDSDMMSCTIHAREIDESHHFQSRFDEAGKSDC